MRTLLKIKFDVEAANKAIVDGTLGQVIDALVERTHPEASYFLAEDGRRTGYFIFDMKNSSEMPGIVEPFFLKLNAEVTFTPVMNHEDLKKGLQLWRDSTTG